MQINNKLPQTTSFTKNTKNQPTAQQKTQEVKDDNKTQREFKTQEVRTSGPWKTKEQAKADMAAMKNNKWQIVSDIYYADGGYCYDYIVYVATDGSGAGRATPGVEKIANNLLAEYNKASLNISAKGNAKSTQTLNNAGQSMLAQANQKNQSVLNRLK